MKIFLLANPDSVHTINWVNALSEKGIEIYLFGLSNYDKNNFNKNIVIESLNISSDIKDKPDASLFKIIYLTSLKRIKELIKNFKPDILHAYYLSSYGLLGALANYHPYIISVWGSDIYFVPEKNIIHKKLIEYSLNRADLIFSTSNSMMQQTKRFTNRKIIVTPFGINLKKFRRLCTHSFFDENTIVIGTIKALEERYGIEYLIKAFKLVKERLYHTSLKLMIIGKGTQYTYLRKIVKDLNLEDDILFTGFVTPDKIPEYHNMIDIFVALSTEHESFGVAVLEALACQRPVVVSDVEGFVEIVKGGQFGLIVKRKNIEDAAEALIKLIMDKELREKMGEIGRKFVSDNYNWDNSVNKVYDIYRNLN